MGRLISCFGLVAVAMCGACSPTCPPTEAERQAWVRCDTAGDETACAANGGTAFVRGRCVCPSLTDGCRCRDANDCLGFCAAEPPPGADGLPFDCTGHGPASCVGQTGGCQCYLQADGSANGICLDR